MGCRTQYFTYLWRYSWSVFKNSHRGSCTKPSNCSNKIKMPKSTTGCRIKSFLPVENMNVEKLRDIQSNLNNSSQVPLKLIQKSASFRCIFSLYLFLFYNDFCKLLIIKDSLIYSWNTYNLIGKFLTHYI